MAQRTEKEETEFKVPETLTPCTNNCGVTGNPATNNMCQKCFNATTATSSSSSSNTSAKKSGGGVGAVTAPISRKTRRSSPYRASDGSRAPGAFGTDRAGVGEAVAVEKKSVNRCSGCRRKVGLTGFRCRCGELFCAEHRYSDRHDCSYDYKTAGREAIARENPVVRASKIVRV